MNDLSQPLMEILASQLAVSEQAIAAIDYAQVIRFFNDGAEKVFGYASQEVLGKSLDLLIPNSARTDHRKYVERFFASKEVARLREQRLGNISGRRKDGTEFPAKVSITKVDHEGTEYAVFILTEQTDVAEEPDQTADNGTTDKDALWRMQRMETIGHLASGLAHDLNNQLTVVIGCIELLEEHTASDSNVSELVGIARAAAERSTSLTQGLLRFGRLESTRQAMCPGTVIEGSLTLFEQSIGERITLRFDGGSRALIHADRMQFENAIANLVLNARDAMPEGGLVAIAVETIAVDAAGRESPTGSWVKVRLNDNGIGMSEEIKSQVLKPFFTTKPPDQGTGLGLSMVHGFVGGSDGTLHIDSTEGVGTTIEMYFPEYRGERESDAVPDGTAPAHGSGPILVVEDDVPLRSLMMRHVSRLGYEPIGAEDVSSALDILRSNANVRLVLTDLMMPGRMSGYDLALHLRESWPDTRVLLVSGYDAEDIPRLRDATDTESFPLLKKPFSRTELAEAISSCLAPAG